MARKRYRQSRRNAVIQWLLPLMLMVVVVLVQTRLEREIGWLLLLVVLGFMVWFGVLYEKSRDEERETGRQGDSGAGEQGSRGTDSVPQGESGEGA